MEITDIDIKNNPQELYDSFNNFIISGDRHVFNKLIARTLIYNSVKDIPGDIVECGVFKGTGLYTFLKLKKLMNPNSIKKVIGFDFFNTDDLIKSIKNKQDKDAMSTLFNGRNFSHNKSFKNDFENTLLENGFSKDDFKLVEGDIINTSKEYTYQNPGCKISLLYIDLDLEEPTYQTLTNLWDNISVGGIIVFDEYGYDKWSESRGADKFAKEKNLKVKSLNYYCPTAYIIKT